MSESDPERNRITRTGELAATLIRCASVTPDDAGCQEILAARLRAIGFETQTLRYGDVTNLWARRGRGAPLFVFAGHTDVVPPGPLESWKVPPFEARREDGRLHGRGAADMKGSLAAMITATEAFVDAHGAHAGSIGFLITSDEEGPAVDGTVKVVEHLCTENIKIDYCLVGEPTSREKLGDMIKVGRRGSLSAQIRIEGKQGHVAYPDQAINPVPLAARLIEELDRIEWDSGNAHFPPTSFQISNIHAGTGAGNVIPGHVDISCNFRFSPESNPDQLKRALDDRCRALGAPFRIDWTLFGMPFQTSEGRLLDAVTRAIFDETGIQTECSTSGGTSDGRFIAPTGAEVVELGPLNATIHRVNEEIGLNDLGRLSRIYERVLETVLL